MLIFTHHFLCLGIGDKVWGYVTSVKLQAFHHLKFIKQSLPSCMQKEPIPVNACSTQALQTQNKKNIHRETECPDRVNKNKPIQMNADETNLQRQ
jgi:hypothetical protein